MSKWINKDLFKEFAEEKKNETQPTSGGPLFEKKWKALEKGPSSDPKTYEVRFLPDVKNGFYKKIHYHMWKVGEKYVYYVCPKTDDFNNPCPICSAVNKLFAGSEDDKKIARNMKRKEKYVSNVFVAYDPRDAGKDASDESKSEGKILLYEFPSKIEQKLAEEIKDSKNGLGHSIFDPSSEGYNFIIKVGTQSGGGENKQSFPEYSMSTFARRPNAIADSEEEIDRLMGERTSLDDYISKGKKPMKDLIEAVKTEMLWELIERDFSRYLDEEPKKEVEKTKVEEKKKENREDGPVKPKNETPKTETKEEEDLDEAALLAELENFN